MTPCSAETERGTGYNWTFRPISSALPFGKAPKTEPEAPVDLSQKFDPNNDVCHTGFRQNSVHLCLLQAKGGAAFH